MPEIYLLMKIIHWAGNNLSGIAAMGTLIVVVVGQIRHRKHEATSDDTNDQITILLNGGLQRRIEEAVEKHVGETLK